MIYHGRVVGPAGQVYFCEHNHKTETAAIRCANSSATRQIAALAWARAAAQAAQAAELARKRAEERQAAEARRAADRAAEEARRAAAQKAAQEAKAAKRAAKLAAMKPERAWRRMTPAERLLKTAETELEIYGEIRSANAKNAYDERSQRLQPPQPQTPAKPAAPSTASAGHPPALAGDSRTSSDLQRPADRQARSGGQPAASSSDTTSPARSGRQAGFDGDGLYVVGLDIEPGVYRTAGPARGARAGYFALLRSTNTNHIINNGRVKGPATITVGPEVKAVDVRDCQPWQRLGDDLDSVVRAAASQRSNGLGPPPSPHHATEIPSPATAPLPIPALAAPGELTPYPVPGLFGLTPEITALVSQGRKIQAIKLYREQNPGVGLKEAKDIIDQIS